MNKVTELKNEIEAKKLELLKLEETERKQGCSTVIKDLSEYTDIEKINAFDKFYKSAELMFTSVETSGFNREDDKQYTWEDIMGLLARDKSKFWAYYNKLSR